MESGSDSSEDKKVEQPICYRLMNPILNVGKKVASCQIKIPSDALPRYANPVGDSEATLIVKDANGHDAIHCINIMTECRHKNILHALVVAKKDGYFLVWTDFYKDSVQTFLDSTALGTYIPKARQADLIMLPTANLRDFVRHAFDGLEHLWSLGKYHGNFTLKNTFYQNLDGTLVAKLTDFRLKGGKIIGHCQAEDCQAIGLALENVSEAAAQRNVNGWNFDCYIIDDLTRKLKTFAWGDLPYIKQEIYAHPFFWNDDDVRNFFVSQIPISMNSVAFRNRVSGCKELCTLPWGENGYGGFVKLMDDYRSGKSMPIYNKESVIDYVKFLSGLYVHEKELKGGSVHAAVRLRSPRAFMILYNLMPRAPRKKSN